MFKPLALITAAVCTVLCMSVTKAELSRDEQRLVDHAETHKEDAIRLLEEAVNINSGTMNHPGVRATGDLFRREFDALGLETTWFDMREVNRAGHLFAEHRGDSRCMLLVGHLDTVFEPGDAFQRFERNGDIARGPGVNDMKGGDVVIVQALKALAAEELLERLELIVAFTGDEEKSGSPKSISRKHLVDAAERCDVALGFEIATSLDEATVARRGSSNWRLTVTGKQAHSSGIFSDNVGSGAIFEAARILNTFHERLTGERYLTFNPGVIVGGTDVEYDSGSNTGSAFGKTNVVSRSARVHGGLRTISVDQLASARERMRAIVEDGNLPHTSATIEFRDGYPAMPPTAGNTALLDVLSAVNVDLGRGPVSAYDPGKRGAADVSFVAGSLDVIDGLGAEGNGAHTPAENIDLSTLPFLIARTAILIHRLR